jgi:hypothetical protein
MVKATETAPPQWWETAKVIFAMGFSSPITWTIMGLAVAGALTAWYCERVR